MIRLLVFITILNFNTSIIAQSNATESRTMYFDTLYQPIKKNIFYKIAKNRNVLEVVGDSTNHRVLVNRNNIGEISNTADFYEVIEDVTQTKINRENFVLVIYYPGKDACNSSGNATRKSTGNWYNKMEKIANKIEPTTTYYFYKDEDGLYGKNDGFKTWHKDPETFLQRLFFKSHYPCSSFVLISPSGKYFSYYGEFSKDQVGNAITILKTR